jgi:hypothetical protein
MDISSQFTMRFFRGPTVNFFPRFCVIFLLLSTGIAQAAATPGYELLDDLLMRNVLRGFVDYDGLSEDARFDTVIDQIGATDAAMLDSEPARLAFYINAYNALAIKGVLDGLSPASRRGRSKFFERTRFLVLGQEISLSALEQDRIIPVGDPRIHFAIVCASLSCPRLSSRAYLSSDLNTQLHDAARQFINDPTRNRFDLERRIAFVSMIFKWYEADFAKAGGSVQQYLARFVDDARIQDGLRLDEFELRYEEYDWNLNGRFAGQKK